ncbi:MAG: hypothetical protein IPJ81_13375 [Chitinophagaceae bacterium]|nr:hypothetical protein [Chitinophagaceae bacterium]
MHYWDAYEQAGENEVVTKNPSQSKLVNATKISGRTQKGLGIGILNAVTKPQFAIIKNNDGQLRNYRTEALTNYNVLVLDQTMKHNSSISLVNTNVMRSGNDYDANVSAFLFDINDKTNTWNIGGNVSMSTLLSNAKNTTGYAHSIYFGKTSGRFNFTVWQDLFDDKYDKSDLGYFTNNNTMDQGIWSGYNWTKPTHWYNQMRVNADVWFSRLVSPIDILNRKDFMYQSAGANVNANAQTKKLWWFGINMNWGARNNDFYEARNKGRVFQNKGKRSINAWWESNSAKKLSWGGNIFTGTGSVFKTKNLNFGLFGKVRFSSKFSVDHTINVQNSINQPGWAHTFYSGIDVLSDTIIFSKRDVKGVENIFNVKYSFTNRMGTTLRVRHYWSKVNPLQFLNWINTEIYKPHLKPLQKT